MLVAFYSQKQTVEYEINVDNFRTQLFSALKFACPT